MPKAAEDGPLTREERRLRGLLYLNAAIALAFVALYVAGALCGRRAVPLRRQLGGQGRAVRAAVACSAAADVRRHGWLALVVAFGYACLIAMEAVMLAVGGAGRVTSFGVTVQPVPYLLGWLAADVVLAAALVLAWWSAVRARHGLRYLNPLAFLRSRRWPRC